MRVLVAEDHVALADRIAEGLRDAGLAVDVVNDGSAALAEAELTAYDVIVLDRDLPVVHGDQVCRHLAGRAARILMLTAAAGVEDRVDGLELGADDYLGKPFDFQELVARVRALGRRGPSGPPIVRRGDLTVDRARHRASRGPQALSLTRKEFAILEMLLAADGRVVSAEELLEHVWDTHADPFSNVVSVTMARLRRKLGDPPLIVGGRLQDVMKAELEADPAYRAAHEACGEKLPNRTPCPVECKEAAQQGARYQRDTTLAHLLRYSLTTLAASTLLAALAGWVIAGRVLRPVHQITAAARAASEHNLSGRVALRGPRDELRVLADTFDTMLGRLQAAFESQRRFIANAGHELRTPLTVMRITVDVVLAKPAPTPEELRGMAQDVRTAVEHAERLINALLTLARTERGSTVRDEVDLATVAEDVLDATDRGDLRLHASLEPARTLGDSLLLERLVANLVDNAARYNVAGGELWLTTSTVDGMATLAVANTGPVIADGAVPGLFQPFERLHDRIGSDGFGLGLAIVASITAAHHGTVTAEPRPGGGLTVTVTVPGPH